MEHVVTECAGLGNAGSSERYHHFAWSAVVAYLCPETVQLSRLHSYGARVLFRTMFAWIAGYGVAGRES